jgi:hypothetical protein
MLSLKWGLLLYLFITDDKATGRNIWSSGGTIEIGSGDCVANATATKVEIRHGPFAVSLHAWFYSEGERQSTREATMKCARH